MALLFVKKHDQQSVFQLSENFYFENFSGSKHDGLYDRYWIQENVTMLTLLSLLPVDSQKTLLEDIGIDSDR